MGQLVVIILSLFLTYWVFEKIIKNKSGYIVRCLLFGYILRVGLMLVDLYTSVPILGSGADSEDFHRNAMQYMVQGYNGLEEYNYAWILGIVYSLTDGSRLFAQYLNVAMGMWVLFVMLEIMKMLNVPLERQKKVVLISAVMPNLVIFSAILLREAWIEFFMIWSLYWFIKWYLRKENALAITLSVVFALLSSWMHAGCIFVVIGYFAAYITYDRKKERFMLSKSSIVSLVFLGIFAIIFMSYLDVFGGKFAGLADMDADQLAGMAEEGADGGSIYLSWLPLTFTFIDIIYLPIRMFYFLFSPIPFDWRGINDIVAFIIDSLIYIWLFYRVYKDIAKTDQKHLLGRYILLAVMLAVAVFSIGTVAAGTAMRHRAKMVSFIFILFTLYETNNKKLRKIYESRQK